ncbi:hypothetical protein [Escherichia fergusonii]
MFTQRASKMPSSYLCD